MSYIMSSNSESVSQLSLAFIKINNSITTD